MRRGPAPLLVLLALAAAVAGGALALAIGAGAGWIGRQTKTVVVNAQSAPQVELPAAVRSSAPPISGNDFNPARIFASRSPGVVTIFAFFGDPASSSVQGAQGSGFVISSKGYILTNSHVITNAGEVSAAAVKPASHVYVQFSDGDRARATVVGWDVYDDVGLIRVDPRDHALTPVPLGDSSSAVVGEPVAAIGSPLGNEDSLSVGVVSGVHRAINALTVAHYNIVDAIQTDAAITHGNSGGPLLDARGRVIGINAQIRSQSGTGNDSGVGFAVPIDSAKRSVAQLVRTGHVRYAYVGITTEDLTRSLATALGYSVKEGALIEGVRPNGPGADAGLRGSAKTVDVLGYAGLRTGGDVIVAIDGKPVRNADDVVRIVSFDLRPGSVATFTIVRGKTRKTVAVTLGDRAQAPAAG